MNKDCRMSQWSCCYVLGVTPQGGSPLSNQENDCSKSEDAATAEAPDYERWVLLTGFPQEKYGKNIAMKTK